MTVSASNLGIQEKIDSGNRQLTGVRSKMGAISALAEYLTSLSIKDIPQTARHSAVRCLIDVIGCAAAGRTNSVVSSVVANGTRWAVGAFPLGKASVWFEGVEPLSAIGAAFVNSLSASVLDVDDGHRAASGHPGAAVIPAVIAVAESVGARFSDLILAIVCGYEAGIGVAAARESSPLNNGATGRWSAVAVAAAVGKLRGFSVDVLSEAIAVAEPHAPNMAAADHAGFAGSHTKEGIPWSVLTGIAAAEQAALGMRGYAGGLDNPVVYRKGLIPRPSTGNFLIETTYFKPYACCRWIHSAIDAVLDMRAGGLDPTAIERIEVASFRRALSLGNALRPSDIISAQFSIPFALAVALLEGPQALLPMSPDLLGRADLLDLAARTVMVLAPELEARFPGEVPARITIKTRGCTIEREVYCPLGDPGNPLSDSRLVEKAVRLCSPMRVSEDVRNFASNLLGTTLSQIETASFETVIDFVRGSPKSLAEVSGQNSQTHTPVRGD